MPENMPLGRTFLQCGSTVYIIPSFVEANTLPGFFTIPT